MSNRNGQFFLECTTFDSATKMALQYLPSAVITPTTDVFARQSSISSTDKMFPFAKTGTDTFSLYCQTHQHKIEENRNIISAVAAKDKMDYLLMSSFIMSVFSTIFQFSFSLNSRNMLVCVRAVRTHFATMVIVVVPVLT